MRSQDAEYFRVLDELMTRDEILFRVGIGHLLSVGYESLTEEAVQRTIEVIEKEASEKEERLMDYVIEEISSPSEGV